MVILVSFKGTSDQICKALMKSETPDVMPSMTVHRITQTLLKIISNCAESGQLTIH